MPMNFPILNPYDAGTSQIRAANEGGANFENVIDGLFRAYQLQQGLKQQGIGNRRAAGEFQASTGFNPGTDFSRLEQANQLSQMGAGPQGTPLSPDSRDLFQEFQSFQDTFKMKRQSQGLDVLGKQVGIQKDLFSMQNTGSESGRKDEKQLRGEVQDLSKDFFKIRDSFSRIQASAQNPSAAGDLALIFNYMKILDPGSTVREGEFANAQNAGSVSQRVIAQYNKVLNGERLSDIQRKDFLDQAGSLYSAQERNQKNIETQYKDLATRYGISPDNVVLQMGLPGATSRSNRGPQIGVVEDGYRFKGGNPGDPNNWEKM